MATKSFQTYVDSVMVGNVLDDDITLPALKKIKDETQEGKWVDVDRTSVTYTFALHQHPFAEKLVDALITGGVSALEAKDTAYKLGDKIVPGPIDSAEPELREVFFEGTYGPQAVVPAQDEQQNSLYPVKELDFSEGGAYAGYNWELFFHVPLTVAIHLSRNQRFAEAQQWFHYVFDPTDNSNGDAPARFWKVKPFQNTAPVLVDSLLRGLATGKNLDAIEAIQRWRDKPFRPHAVARSRPSAYMMKAVTAYLDNLLAWGDSLFRQDTIETINEATQLYVLAANILGPRPQAVPKQGSVRPETYESLRDRLDEFSNALVALETDVPYDAAPLPRRIDDGGRSGATQSQVNTLYFCIPPNDALMGYWDTVADRLFKIRNSLNLQGIFRQLPLFEPPIDPALLARAAAAGLDLAAVIASANQPLPLVRYQVLIQKAAEICQEVKSLGSGLLSAIEKEDNEALSILRAKHERVILELAEAVKYGQWQEAIKNREGLQTSILNAAQRYAYYERMLGVSESEIKLPEIDALDPSGLLALKFKAEEPEVRPRSIEMNLARNLDGELRGHSLLVREAEELEKLGDARIAMDVARVSRLAAQAMEAIPEFDVHFHYWGIGGSLKTGGPHFARLAQFAAGVSEFAAEVLNYQAGQSARLAGFERREMEWALQSNTIAGEITQLFKQLRAAEIREALAERELRNHQQQIKNAKEIEAFLTDEKKGKHSNQALYAWMKREVRGLYSQCFQFAFDVAKKTERALQYELGDSSLSFLQFGYTAGKEGLLAGEKLFYDLKRMEMAYHDLNQREYELTKNVSLLQLDPEALLQLRQTGRCDFSLPEELFDLGGAGHYFRRIKSVAVSIPCVAGPYTGVNCTLTLRKSSVRTTPRLLEDGAYARVDANDDRFQERTSTIQSIVTSTGQNDGGLFEVNLKDERYLPFEGAGVVSDWELKLPHPVHLFDYETISDVILHIRYTAREGGIPLATAATANLSALTEAATAAGTVRLFSVREEFPSEWATFTRLNMEEPSAIAAAFLTLTLREEHYPFWTKAGLTKVPRIDFYALIDKDVTVTLLDPGDPQGNIELGSVPLANAGASSPLGKLRVGTIPNAEDQSLDNQKPTIPLTLKLTDNSMSNLWIALTWAGAVLPS